MARDEADFNISNEGSVHLFTALSDSAIAFVENEIVIEDWQRFGKNTFAVESRVSFDLYQNLISEGFRVI